MPVPPAVTPVVLLILDGVGCRPAAEDNAVSRARKPNWDRLVARYPLGTIDASEGHVGLPAGQMGNSEVGHLNIGAGRVVYQDLTRVDHALETGEFQSNPVLRDAIGAVRRRRGTLHVMGLLSPGGVHSHERHIHALVRTAAEEGVAAIRVHAFLDGRDTPPKSALASLVALQEVCANLPDARIASVVGRYYAMDRDKRWERVAEAYALVVDGRAAFRAADPGSALEAAYGRGETDEFVKATVVAPEGNEPARIRDGDAVVFMNFRADRARELTRALTAAEFDGFPRDRVPRLSAFVCLSSYGDDFRQLPAMFGPESVRSGFGEYVASLGLAQLRIAETEKYAHVTYFFSGGVEQPYPNEDRILVPSPKVATYDLKPEMSAIEVTDRLVEAIRSRRYQAIVCNYANGDMVGHTGDLGAATRAIETLDGCVGRVVDAQVAIGGEVLVTADHGNAESMHDPSTGQPHTAHTLNLVPLLYVGRPARVLPGGALKDIAPTLLRMMGVPQPAEMTGRPLVEFV